MRKSLMAVCTVGAFFAATAGAEAQIGSKLKGLLGQVATNAADTSKVNSTAAAPGSQGEITTAEANKPSSRR